MVSKWCKGPASGIRARSARREATEPLHLCDNVPERLHHGSLTERPVSAEAEACGSGKQSGRPREQRCDPLPARKLSSERPVAKAAGVRARKWSCWPRGETASTKRPTGANSRSTCRDMPGVDRHPVVTWADDTTLLCSTSADVRWRHPRSVRRGAPARSGRRRRSDCCTPAPRR